jgi:hypothetical protein
VRNTTRNPMGKAMKARFWCPIHPGFVFRGTPVRTFDNRALPSIKIYPLVTQICVSCRQDLEITYELPPVLGQGCYPLEGLIPLTME